MTRRLTVFSGAAVAVALLLFLLLVPTGIFWSVARPALHKDVINRHAARHKFDPLFIMALVRAESGFSKEAISRRGAVGLMQLMPETGLEMARRTGADVTVEELADPEVNIRLGVHYLSILRDEFGGDVTAILSAYNAGPTNARAWRKDGLLKEEDIPYPETRAFVHRVRTTHDRLRFLQKVKNVFH